jgi:putative nucleotidyltransferase with HDIG domain
MGVYLIVNLIIQTFGQAAHSGQTLSEALVAINRAALVLYPTSFWIGWILAAGLQKYGLITLTGLWVPWFVARTLIVNHTKLQGSYRDALRTLVKLLQSFDPQTRRHVERVAKLAVQMADELGLPQNARRDLEDAALLHDIGKIRLDEALLNKVGKPSPREWEEIMRHPQLGYEILSEMKPFQRVAEFVLCHHERPDGNGYPRGLRERDIPLESSIIAVADAFEVMTARFAGGDHRSYQPSFMADQALERIKGQAGTQFVGSVVFALERVLRRHGMVD